MDESQAVSQFIDTSPEAQALLEQYGNDPAIVGIKNGARPNPLALRKMGEFKQRMDQLLQSKGMEMPHDFYYNLQNGGVEKQGFLSRNANWLMYIPLAVAGGGVAAGVAAGGAAGAAGASSAGGGIGETAAVTGVTPAIGGSLGTGATAGTGIGTSILSKAGPYAEKLAPILGGMAKSGAEANQNRDRILPSMEHAQLARDKYALDAPSTRMSQSVRASAIKNAAPVKVNWGGPGSGLRGEVPNFTGGYTGAVQNLDPQSRQLADTVLAKTLQDQLAGRDDESEWLDKFGSTSVQDKIVGGAATAANIYAGIRR